jgi:hypothetical protein
MAARIAGVGRVIVSLNKSIRTTLGETPFIFPLRKEQCHEKNFSPPVLLRVFPGGPIETTTLKPTTLTLSKPWNL